MCLAIYLQSRGWLPLISQLLPSNFAPLSSPSSLANSCMFLIGICKIIRNLAQFALGTTLGRRRRMLFLVRLKNRRIFSLCSLCLNCNAHDSGDIFFVQREWRNLELPPSSKTSGCGRLSSQGALYKRWNLGKLNAHRVQRKNVKQNEFHPVPKGAFGLQTRATS